MNPLSIWTYIRRNIGRVVTVWSVTALATVAIIAIVGLIFATFAEPIRSLGKFYDKFAVMDAVSTDVAHIRSNPDVAQTLPTMTVDIYVPELLGCCRNFLLLGLQEGDVETVLNQSNVRLKDGRMIQPRTNEVLLSEQVANVLDLQIGDIFQSSDNPEFYVNIIEPMRVVGILAGDVRLGIISYEYLNSHERYRSWNNEDMIVIAQPGREAAVDRFLQDNTDEWVRTKSLVDAEIGQFIRELFIVLGPLAALIAIAVSIAISLINQLTVRQRLPEFGILYAAGYGKRWITTRLVKETVAITVTGWLVGIGLGIGLMALLRAVIYAPRGHDVNIWAWAPIVPTVLIPLAVIPIAYRSLTRTLTRLDAIAVIESGELESGAEEKGQDSGGGAKVAISAPNPLSPWLFYKRHKRRSLRLTGVTALMIMAVVSLIIVIAIPEAATKPRQNNLRHLSGYRALNSPYLDPGAVSQIRSHPAVERVIPALDIYPLTVSMPPLSDSVPDVFAVSTEDMVYIMAQYNLTIKEGRLPQPRTNEIILPEAVAINRNIQIGDVIGSRDAPLYPGANTLEYPLTLSGIFARAPEKEDETWLGFTSIEFYYSMYEGTDDAQPSILLISAKPGQKAAIDRWLHEELQADNVDILSYQRRVDRENENRATNYAVFGMMEGVIAMMAAIVLAVLSFVFVAQRRAEFGVLSALGYSNGRLIWRTAREMIVTIGISWILSLVLCLCALLVMKFFVLGPRGMATEFIDPMPWLFTIPVPVMVLFASTAAIAWSLLRLDPVSIIERH